MSAKQHLKNLHFAETMVNFAWFTILVCFSYWLVPLALAWYVWVRWVLHREGWLEVAIHMEEEEKEKQT